MYLVERKIIFKLVIFGCKLNQAESEKISKDLILAGFFEDRHESPDFIIVNACAVTQKAVRSVRQKVSSLKREYKKSKVIVMGCVVDNSWPGVDFWVKNKDKEKIIEIIKKFFFDVVSRKSESINDGDKRLLKVRGFVKIQDGCNNFCSYCIIPFLRGKPKSLKVDDIIYQILEKEKNGYKEIVLTGVNIGLYNTVFDNKKIGLTELLKIILNKTKISRIRLGSLWPTYLDIKLMCLLQNDRRLCPHLHLSIQSGSDKILKLMRRNYKSSGVLQIIKKARERVSNINFTCDIIVGFPGETEDDFGLTCDFASKAYFSKIHIFKYSDRPGASAAKISNKVNEKIKQTRSNVLFKLSEKISAEVKNNFCGQFFSVLFENKKNGYWYGFTENYLKVKKKSDKLNLKNKVCKIKLKKNNLI